MSEPESEYQDSLSKLEDALQGAVRDFARWVERNWTMTPEQWKQAYDEPPPAPEWFVGHSAAMTSLTLAANCYLDEFHP